MVHNKFVVVFLVSLITFATAFNLPKLWFSGIRSSRSESKTPVSVASNNVEITRPTPKAKYYERKSSITIYQEDVDFEEPSDEAPIESKQPLLFLPGLDGVGNYSAGSVRKLNVFFDVYKMSISGDDRSTFMEVAQAVIKTLNTFDKPAVLVGESFGGLLASYIALRVPSKVDKLVLINPATSFDRTAWPLLAPVIASTGPAFPVVGLATLMGTAVDFDQFRRVGKSIMERINSTQAAVTVMNEMFGAAVSITKLLPPETLEWRINKWFNDGNFLMKDRYKDITVPTLIMSGKNDRLLPSRNEGRRLVREMRSAERVQLKEFNCGHALLDGTTIDFGEEIMSSEVFNPKKHPLDISMPTEAEMANLDRQVGPFLKALSPVFLSRGPDGYLRRGLAGIPTGREGRPVLLVGNHQLYGADLAPIVKEFISEKDVLIRGLAHPMMFMKEQGFGQGGYGDQMARFGAVEVSPMNIFELFKRNETVLLFPGGAREALHGKGEEYKLFWPEKVDFVRMAGIFDAIIVPFAAVGVADSVDIVLDREDFMQIPFIGDRIRNSPSDSRMPSARAGVTENFMPPLFVPRAPERNYFLFQEPIDTRDVNIYDKKQCRELYDRVRGRVEDGITTLMRFREADPYKEFVPRTIYEMTAGGKQAPTAPLNLKW